MALKSKVAIEVDIKNVKKITELKDSLKQLRKEQRQYEKDVKNGVEVTKKSADAYIKNEKAIVKNSKALRETNKEVKGVTKSSNGMAKQFVKGAAVIGLAIGGFKLLTNILGNAVKVFKDFEFQMAKVRAVTGATEEDFRKLRHTARELGRTTFFTATQVASLQENFAKLGFTTKEILNAQDATISLATATGSDLARAAIVAGSAVRGFGLDASETQRVVDVMAVSFTSSALDIEKFQTAMTKVAPIAKSAGFSIEDTTAIMAQLSDAGIEASIAGTSLRNILLKMQDPNSDLVQSFGKTIHSLDELVPALNKFSEEGGSLAEIMEVVDLRQAAAFEQMITSRERTLALRDALVDANGAAAEMASIIGDTLEGDLRELTSAWQGLQESIVSGSGTLTKGIRGLVDVLTELANKVTDYNKTTDDLALDLFSDQMAIVNTQLKDQEELFKSLSEEDKKIYGKTTSDLIQQRINDLKEQLLQTARLKNTKIALNEDYDAEVQKIITLRGALTQLRKSRDNEQNQEEKSIESQKEKIKIIEDERVTLNQLKEDLKNLEEIRGLLDVEDSKALAKNQQQIDALKKRINAINGVVKATEEENKVNKEKLDLDSEIVAQIISRGISNEEELIRVRKHLNKIRREEIELQLRSMNQFVMDVDLRKKLLAELEALENENFTKTKDNTDAEQKQKDDAFASDVKRALMSGQSATEAMKTVVRAQIMEAVAGYIASVFKSVPWPFNLIVAAGASALIGGLIDSQLSKFGRGGTIEEFADGGMVHGASHAQGGVKFAVGGRVNELEGGEAVINKRSTAMFKNELSAMNVAGGGVKFADGGLLSSPQFAQAQFSANNQSQMMGAMQGQRRVVVVESDITDSQNTVGVIQANATF